MLGFSISTLGYLLFVRIRKNIIERKTNEKKEFYQNALMEIIFSGEELVESDFGEKNKELKEYVHKSKRNRIIFLEELGAIHKNLEGESRIVIEKVFKLLDMDEFSIKTLRKGSWVAKAISIQQLSTFKVKESYPVLLEFIDDKNQFIREEAQLAAINIGEEKALDFIYVLKSYLSNWQQIRLLESLRKVEIPMVPDYKKWFSTDNKSVVIFGLKMIKSFNHYDGLMHVKKYLTFEEEEEVIIELLKSLKALQVPFFNEELIGFIDHPAEKISVKAIETLSVTFDEEEVDVKALLSSNSYDVFLAVNRFCLANKPMVLEEFSRQENIEPWKLNVLEHSSDRRLN